MRHDIYTGYKKRKAKNAIKVKKIKNQIILEIDRYDTQTGEKKIPQIRPVELSKLIERRNNIQAVVDDISEMITDIESLE